MVNHKRLFRLYREEKARGAPPWRPQAWSSEPGHDAGCEGANKRWSFGSASDKLTGCRRFRPSSMTAPGKAGKPDTGGRRLALRRPHGAGTGPADDRARRAEDDRQRQWQRALSIRSELAFHYHFSECSKRPIVGGHLCVVLHGIGSAVNKLFDYAGAFNKVEHLPAR